VWGACEDVQVLEKLRSGEYKIDNLHIIDEAHSRLLDVGGVKLRLLGLGGAVVMHKLFDNGEGRTTIAGGQGTMWTTLLQMGELIDTANRVYDPAETRIFVTHASPAREGLLNQLSVTLKSDFSVSAGLHFRYGSSYNEFSVNPTLDHYRGKLAASKASFDDVWQTVKNEVEPAVAENESQNRLLRYALDLVDKMPNVANGGNPFGGAVGVPGSGQIDESAFKNMWNFNLADAAYGWLVLDIDSGRIGTEMRAQGFNFAHRGGKTAPQQQVTTSASPAPSQNTIAQHRPPPQQNRQVPPTQVAGNRGPGLVPPQQGPGHAGPSPQHSSAREAAKPQTRAVSATPPNPGGSTGEKGAVDVKSNGTLAQDKPADATKTETLVHEKPKSRSLFIRFVNNDDEARSTLPEEDHGKIERIEKIGTAFIVHFKSPEEMESVFRKVGREFKSSRAAPPGNEPAKPLVAINRGSGGTWQPSARGGPHGGGYRSGGGGASDSETGRGGGFRGRVRGSRGGERGDRGNRGQRGGRGNFNRSGAGEGSAPATPVPVTGDA
jgi:hypothetical protein